MQRAKQISESIELGIILALAGGFMDVYSYIGRDHVFANAQTGNILLVGVSISEGNWALAGRYFFPVVSFAVGIMLADLVHERFGSVIHWRQVTVFFEAVILFFKISHLNVLPLLKFQASFASSFCKSSYAAMVQVTTTVKHNGLDPFFKGFLGDFSTNNLGCFDVAAVVFFVGLFNRGSSDEGFAGFIVDDLSIDVAQGAIYVKTGSFSSTHNISAHAHVTFLTCSVLIFLVQQEIHSFLLEITSCLWRPLYQPCG